MNATATATATESTGTCLHEGYLTGQCAACIREHMQANMRLDALELSDVECALISTVIDEFVERHPNLFTVTGLDDDLTERISSCYAGRDDEAETVVELIEILVFG